MFNLFIVSTMLSNSSNITANTVNSNSSSPPSILITSSVSCWPALEPSLNLLLPPHPHPSTPLSSDDYLKLYTVVFEYCVGASEGEKKGNKVAGLNVSGEELYRTLVKYLEIKFSQWASVIIKGWVYDSAITYIVEM